MREREEITKTTTKARKFQNGNEQSQKNNDWNFDNKTTIFCGIMTI
jgi:hypothetical protein